VLCFRTRSLSSINRCSVAGVAWRAPRVPSRLSAADAGTGAERSVAALI
jgi:hypothetical protein